jgi:hypothetical protein
MSIQWIAAQNGVPGRYGVVPSSHNLHFAIVIFQFALHPRRKDATATR